MESRKYNTGQLFIFPLVGDGVADFVADYVPAAGDAKVWTDKLISTNLTSLILGFDSLSELPAQGAQIDENGAGTAEGIIEFTIIVSGTVGGGDAAGFFIMRSVTGQAWSNDDQIDINGGTANIATADSTTYDLAATAGLIGSIGNRLFAAALSPTEMSCSQGGITIIDSATKAIEDQAILFTTYGNPLAMHAVDFDDSVRMGLTSIPNAAADAGGGLVISDVGGLDMDAMNTAVAAVNTDLSNGTDGLGALKTLIDAVNTDLGNGTDGLGALKTLIDAIPTSKTGYALSSTGADLILKTSTFALAIADAHWDEAKSGHLALDSYGQIMASIQTQIGTDGDGLTAVPWNSAWDAEAQSEVADALAAYDPPTKAEMDTGFAALNDISVSDIWTTVLAESYASDGSAFTGAQALFQLWSLLAESNFAGTTNTTKKLNGNDTAMTLTINDPTNPTSSTRTT